MRFGAYETLKAQVPGDSFMHKIFLAGVAGAAGGLVSSLFLLNLNFKLLGWFSCRFGQCAHAE